MKPLIIILLILACKFTATAQNTTYDTPIELGQDSTYYSDYYQFKKLYIQKLDSESHYKVLVLAEEFVEKINHPAKGDAMRYIYNDPLKYIKENLSTTSFESYEAAVEEWEILSEATRDDWEQNREYYKLEDIVRRRWPGQMLGDVAQEIKREYPEKFDLLEKPRKPE